jgi:2'-5' RNA ligase
MRLFLALPFTEQARHDLAHVLSGAIPGQLPGRAVRPENWHVTLRFLGEVDDVGRDRLLAGLDEGDLGPPFVIRWGALGAFPNPRRATVLWVGMERGAEDAVRVAGLVGEVVEGAGFPPEDRPFRAHMTLSRIRPDQDVAALLSAVPPVGVTMPVDRVVMYRSHLGSGGPRYEEIEAFPLD